MNKFTYIFALAICFSQTHLMANYTPNYSQAVSVYCDPELNSCLEKIFKVDEARSLIAQVKQEGPVRVITNKHQLSDQFGAYWDMERRVICVNCQSTEGKWIGSILFELCNAAANSKLVHLDDLASKGQIDKESYVSSVERIEFENSHIAARIANRGIELGIFPEDAFLPTYDTFEEHYKYQKIGGHSAWIAKNYYNLVPQSRY